MSDVTQILQQIESGDPSAAEHLLPLVYEELRKLAGARMAQESPDHTLQPTALVHEAYVRLVDTDKAQHWNSRGHFFGAAAEAMRRILVDKARSRRRQKRGGDLQRITMELDDVPDPDQVSEDLIESLDEALRRFEGVDPTACELVKLRFFFRPLVARGRRGLGDSASNCRPSLVLRESLAAERDPAGRGRLIVNCEVFARPSGHFTRDGAISHFSGVQGPERAPRIMRGGISSSQQGFHQCASFATFRRSSQ